MPIREYICPNGHTVEKLNRTKEEDVEQIVCPVEGCGEKSVQILSTQTFIYCGEGFYKQSASAKRIVNPETITFDGKDKHDYVQ